MDTNEIVEHRASHRRFVVFIIFVPFVYAKFTSRGSKVSSRDLGCRQADRVLMLVWILVIDW